MKKITFTVLVFCLTNIFSATAQTDLITDPLLQDIFKGYESEIVNIRNIDIVKNYLSDNELSETELSDLYYHMGYRSHNAMVDFIKNQNGKLLVLSNKYNLQQYSSKELTEKFKLGYLKSIETNRAVDDCKSEKNNCIASASAQTLLMHLGCAGLDLTIFLGIICHSGATVYQISESNKCIDAYTRCRGLSVQ
jgi:hypothetical protein